ncbi:MAG: hypothetical protein QM530_04820 [Phycisphaerales bacterium]|nr:hypothetical protein [Phycisphaerales bacterium]
MKRNSNNNVSSLDVLRTLAVQRKALIEVYYNQNNNLLLAKEYESMAIIESLLPKDILIEDFRESLNSSTNSSRIMDNTSVNKLYKIWTKNGKTTSQSQLYK